ncbi:hypothetical protein HX13_09175 [Chryseobacterium sp. P1-3]|nr:hypothetical protein HX13_09175 [Chryseobacterium sp. P1-3]
MFAASKNISAQKSSFVVLIIKLVEKVENEAEIILHLLYKVNCPTLIYKSLTKIRLCLLLLKKSL